MYLNPFETRFKHTEKITEEYVKQNAYILLENILSNFIKTSRTVNLRSFESYLDKTKLNLQVEFYPLISNQLGAFLGFFDSGFRVFDFYVGMLDAEIFVTNSDSSQVPRNMELLNSSDLGFFQCLEKFHRTKNLDKECLHENKNNSSNILKSTKILQVSLAILYENCKENRDEEESNSYNCKQISIGNRKN